MVTPLAGATVTVYEEPAGGTETALGTGVTDVSGAFSVPLQRAPEGYVRIATSGGSYTDEVPGTGSTGGSVILALGVSRRPDGPPVLADPEVRVDADQSLQAVAVATNESVLVSPLTSFAAVLAVGITFVGGSWSAAIAGSYAKVARELGLPSIDQGRPAVLADPDALAAANWEDRAQGQVLSGLDEEASSLSVSLADLVSAMCLDLRDGVPDGRNGGTAVAIGDSGPTLPDDASTTALSTAIAAFDHGAGVDTTITPIPRLDENPWPATASAGGSPLGLSVGLAAPDFIDRAARADDLLVAGGTGPYGCKPNGSNALPVGIGLATTSSGGCAISYDGRPILGRLQAGWNQHEGERIAFSNPFDVAVADAAGATLIVHFTGIRLNPAGPVIQMQEGSCPAPGAACDLEFATVVGGTPYMSPAGARQYWFSSSTSGLPPGLEQPGGLAESATLRGTLSSDAPPGSSYTVGVCATDAIGWQDCGQTTVTVPGTPSPTPSETGPAGSPFPTPESTGFPSDIPAGTYDMTICITESAEVSGAAPVDECHDNGEVEMTAQEVALLEQWEVSSAGEGLCGGNCQVGYTHSADGSFDIVIASDDGSYRAEIRLTRMP